MVPPTARAEIAFSLVSRREEAKMARSGSGLEATWTDAEESYVGIDEANRIEWNNAKWTKPTSVDGPLSRGRDPRAEDGRSTAFIKLTSRYVDAGAAKLADIVIPVDGKPFSFDPLPEPDLEDALTDHRQIVGDHLPGSPPLTRPALPHEAARLGQNVVPFSGPPPGSMRDVIEGKSMPSVPLRAMDIAKETIEHRRMLAKRAERHVWNWMVECRYTGEIRKVIHDSAKLGVGVLKGPFPHRYKYISVSRDPNGGKIIKGVERIRPAAKWISPWNFFPDPACGEDIHNGDFCFERDFITEKELRDLKGMPGYIDAEIDAVIKEGPSKGVGSGTDASPADRTKAATERRWEIWYYVGTLKKDEAASLFMAADKRTDDEAVDEVVSCVVTLVNDRAIKATLNPLDSGRYPYHAMPWQRRAGSWCGIGVSEQVRTPQRMCNAAVRAMLDNAGLASGPQIVMDKLGIEPADGEDWKLRPLKVWLLKGARSEGGVKGAFGIFDIKSSVNELLRIIDLAMKFAEESTSIPLVSEGKSNESSPETFGATNLLNANANQLLRDVGASLDINVTEPFFNQLYEWMLVDETVPDTLKEEYRIDARGSIAMIDRAIADQAISQMGPLVKDPEYGADPRKWFKTMLRVKRVHPEDIMMTDDEYQRRAAMPPPKPPQVAVQELRNDLGFKQIAAKQTTEERSMENESQIAHAGLKLEDNRIEAEDRRTMTQATVDLHELRQRHHHELLKYANAQKMKIADVNKELLLEAIRQHGGHEAA